MPAIDLSTLLARATAFDLGKHVFPVGEGTLTAHVELVRYPDGWRVRAHLGPMNVWGLTRTGTWEYKGAEGFLSKEIAIGAFNAAPTAPWVGYS